MAQAQVDLERKLTILSNDDFQKLPRRLNTKHKWIQCMNLLNTTVKFRVFAYKLLSTNKEPYADFYDLFVKLEKDLSRYHKNDNFALIIREIEVELCVRSYNLMQKVQHLNLYKAPTQIHHERS